MNKTYQERMNNSMGSKLAVIEPHIKDGMRVLDVGSGASTELYDFVTQQGATYVAIDSDQKIANYLHKQNINVYTSIDNALDNEKRFDIIYMSSVIHELYSSYNPIEFARIMKRLSKHLKNNGSKLIIRDWMTYNDTTWKELDSVIINPNKIDDINAWIINLNNHGITNPFDVTVDLISATNPHNYRCAFGATKKDIYELIYHTVWGMDSYSRESREHYMVPRHHLMRILKTHCALVENYEVVDTSYIEHLSTYFENAEQLVKDYPAKQIWVYERDIYLSDEELQDILDSI